MGATLKQIRQFLAAEAGPFQAGTTTAGTGTALVEDTKYPIRSSIAQDGLFDSMYLYMPSLAAADRTRIIKSYVPANGTLQPDLGYSVSPGTGTAYEIHGIFDPAIITDLINEGLKSIFLPVEFTFHSASDLYTRHSLAVAAPWLTDPSWVLNVGYLAYGSRPRDEDPPYPDRQDSIRCGVWQDGNTLYLDGISFTTVDTIYVRALKPAYFHCAAAAGVLGSQSGLTLETDIIPDTVPLQAAAYAGLMVGWRQLGTVLQASDRIKTSEDQARRLFQTWNPNWAGRAPRLARPLKHWGPVR